MPQQTNYHDAVGNCGYYSCPARQLFRNKLVFIDVPGVSQRGRCEENGSLFSDQFRRGESDKSKLTGVKGSKLLSNLSDVAWKAFQSVNTLLPEGEAISPKWAPGPLLKSYERSAPPSASHARP